MDEVIGQMSKAKDDVRIRMEKAVTDVVSLCRRYRSLGKSFMFSFDGDLERKVDARLVALGDEIIGDALDRAKPLVSDEEEDEDAMAWATRSIDGKDATVRADGHSSTLKYFLEGWIAIGFAKNLRELDLVSDFFTYIANPYASPLWREAVSDSGYMSASIRSRGYSYGRGNQRNVLGSMVVLAQTMINMAYQRHMTNVYRKSGAIGYRTRRNSNWDCELCDEVASVTHPLTEVVLPVHPRCVCSSYPVYMKDEYPEDRWEHTYRNEKKGGYVATQKERIKFAGKNKQEKAKYEKEANMAKVLADNGYRVEHLSEVSGISSHDITINGIAADLKSLSSHNNIARHFKDATQKQGADAVVFEFKNETKKIYTELKKLSSNTGHKVYYYFINKKKVYKLI